MALHKGFLPNFEDVSNIDQAQLLFIATAKKIIFEHQLTYENFFWRIRALELYLHAEHWSDCWCDPTVHAIRYPKFKDNQLKFGSWYIHRAGPLFGQTGTGPNRSGVDISVGSKNKKIYGGILIGGLVDVSGSSGNALKSIIRRDPSRMKETRWSDEDKQVILEINGTFLDQSPLKLLRCSEKPTKLYIGPRKNIRAEDRYKSKPLRIATTPWSGSAPLDGFW